VIENQIHVFQPVRPNQCKSGLQSRQTFLNRKYLVFRAVNGLYS